jgi:hypothetical protein
MSKAIGIAVFLFAGWAADQQYNYGYFTDGLFSMLSQMRHSFGW